MSSTDLPFYNTFNSGFWLSLTALITAFLAIMLKSCYQSKCTKLKCCCGLLDIVRDVDAEEDIDLRLSDSNINNSNKV
jgi:hypothetical protein